MKTLFRQSHLVVALFLFMGMMVLLPDANATHLRFGHLTWQPKPAVSPNTVEFTLINAFRRNSNLYPGTAPDGFVAIGDVISESVGNTRMRFGDGNITNVLKYRVIAIDVANQWFLGVALQPGDDTKATIDHTYVSPNNGGNPWIAEMFGCCRISNSVNNANGGYSIQTLVELVSGNRSPVASLPPIVNLPQSATASFFVPATDADPNSTLSWRLASAAEAGDGGAFSQPAGLTVNSTTGLVQWNTSLIAIGSYYSCQVIIEDRHSSTGELQTRVAVDFLILIVPCDPGNATPAFVSPSPTCGSTLNAFVGQPFSFTVTATDADPADMVSLNSAGIPAGATLNPGLPITGSAGDPVSSTFDWTPGIGDLGNYVVNFAASDNCGAQALCSYTIIVQQIPSGNAFCTYTQGFYGNAGGTDCMGRTTEQVINDAIGAGITVGSTPANTMDVPANGALCVINRLPGGGPSIAINGGPNDACGVMPGISTFTSGPNNGRMKNTLIGQALTLSLNMGLNPGLGTFSIEDGYDFFSTIEAEDCFDPDSDPDPNGTSQDFYFPSSVASYLQSNYSADVAGLLALANDAISGVAPGGSPSLGNITAALGAINDGFDECRVMLGWDNDPVEKNADKRISEPRLYGLDVSVFPNPSSTEATFMFSVTEKGSVSLEIFNNVGARIEVLFSGVLEANEVYSIAMPVAHLAAGIYHYRFTAGSESSSGSLVIAH